MLGLLSAGISGVGAIAGGIMGNRAARNAAAAQTAGLNRAAGQLQEGNSTAARVLAPYSNEGAGARSLINAALGVPQATGGASAVADEQEVYRQFLADHPDVMDYYQKESAWKKSPHYGSDPISFTKWWLSRNPAAQNDFETAKATVLAKQSGASEAGPTQADASRVFQGTQYAQDANELSNSLWQPIGGERATYADSPWQGMSDRATTKANDLFLGLAGAQGSVLSGNTARGLQENQAYIDDAFHGSYLDAYNNAATGSYNANTSAFNQWMGGLGSVANTGYNADQTVAGNAVGQGAQMANLATGNGQAQSDAAIRRGNATTSMIQGVTDSVSHGIGQYDKPKSNSLYTAASQHMNPAAPVRLRTNNMLNPSILRMT